MTFSGPTALPVGFMFGYLCLTKVFFGYVLAATLVLALAIYLRRRTAASRGNVLVLIVALVTCLPYLVYTFGLTGRPFYWGNSGGMSLYWISTPFEEERGDWFSEKSVYATPELRAHHGAFLDEIAGLDGLEKDTAFRHAAIRNIRKNPRKFVSNWMANVGRLLFNYPYSYTPQKLTTYFYLLPNMFLVVMLVLSAYPAWLGRKRIPPEMYALFLFGLVALAGSSLLSAYERQSRVLLPVWITWIAFVATRFVEIRTAEPCTGRQGPVVRERAVNPQDRATPPR